MPISLMVGRSGGSWGWRTLGGGGEGVTVLTSHSPPSTLIVKISRRFESESDVAARNVHSPCLYVRGLHAPQRPSPSVTRHEFRICHYGLAAGLIWSEQLAILHRSK